MLGAAGSGGDVSPYGYVKFRTAVVAWGMASIKAEEVRIPRSAREAVAQHEAVVVFNRERPAFVIVHPDAHGVAPAPRGRALRDALGQLAHAAPPDSMFAEDMEAVLDSIGPAPGDPWAQS
jgi:hypothetical protein